MINALISIGPPLLECQFPSGPSECVPTPARVQPRDISRGGTMYLYDRGIKYITYRLTYKKVTSNTLTTLEFIIDAAGGAASPDTLWYDQYGTVHTVRFVSALSAKETHPGKLQVSFTLEEYP